MRNEAPRSTGYAQSRVSSEDQRTEKLHDERVMHFNNAYRAVDILNFVSQTLDDFNPKNVIPAFLPERVGELADGSATVIRTAIGMVTGVAEFLDIADFRPHTPASEVGELSQNQTHRSDRSERASSTQTLPSLIDAHRKAHTYFNEVCSITDETHPDYEHGPSGELIWKGASAGEDRALMALCRYIPVDHAEWRLMTSYLAAFEDRNQMDGEHLAAYLKSMARMQ